MSKPIVGNEGEENNVTSGDKPDDSSQTVTYASHKKLLDQKKAQDEKLKQLNERIAQVEAAESAKQEEILKAEKRHDEIIAKQKVEIERLNGTVGKIKGEIADSMKRQALEQAIGGFALPEYAQFAKLDSIPLLEDGSVDQDAVAREGTRIRETYPHLLKSTVSNLPNGAPPASVGGNKPAPTAKELYIAEMEARTGLKLS